MVKITRKGAVVVGKNDYFYFDKEQLVEAKWKPRTFYSPEKKMRGGRYKIISIVTRHEIGEFIEQRVREGYSAEYLEDAIDLKYGEHEPRFVLKPIRFGNKYIIYERM